MKHILSFIIFAFLAAACSDMYELQKKYEGEFVYPGQFDTIVGHIGFERVELDLMKAGRVPASQVKLGKAKQTVVEYDDQVITIDSLASWVNITGLTSAKLYRFSVYTIDEFKNQSVPQEIALIPFTSSDLEALALSSPSIQKSPSSAVINWPNGISSVLMEYCSLSFQYTDKDGVVRSGERGEDSRFFIGNVEPEQTVEVNMKYRVVPLVSNEAILDTVVIGDVLSVSMPSGSTEFSVAEKAILEANGVTVFTSDGVSDIEKLVYPVYASSLQDIFYFPNLKVLDLTGGELFPIPELSYTGNGITGIVGGGEFVPFMRKAGDMVSGNTQSLKDLLESGILEKVYYRPHSMGLDDMLQPYVETGIVELVEGPESVLIPDKFQLDGVVQDNAWKMDITYPAFDAPAGEGLENIYKTVLKAKNASFVFVLPKEYEFNIEEYPYLKMKVYAPAESTFAGTYYPYRKIWLRFMNYLWSFSQNSSFGQQYWSPDLITIDDAELQKWTELTIDMGTALDRHNRAIVINIGGEPSLTWDPPADIIYYFADIRFTREP